MYAKAPPIWEADPVRRVFRETKKRKGRAIALRMPAMATGFQSTDLTSTPPKLHNTAVTARRRRDRR
jgi:hypothetical protein